MTKQKSASALDNIISTKTTATLLLIFAIAIGAATFVEDRYDTITAQRYIYHATWFKTVLVLLVLNFIGNIKRYRLLRREKWSVLCIHIGLILTIVGAGVSHYMGFEGILKIKQGETVDFMYSQEAYLSCSVFDKATGQRLYDMPHERMKPCEACNNFLVNNDFDIDLPLQNGEATLSYNAVETDLKLGPFKDSIEGGVDHLELVFEKMMPEFLPNGGSIFKNGMEITFNNPKYNAINIYGSNEDSLKIDFLTPIWRFSMDTQVNDTLPAGENILRRRHLHRIGNLQLVFKGIRRQAGKEIIKQGDGKGFTMLHVNVDYAGEHKVIDLIGGNARPQSPEYFEMGGKLFVMGFGSIKRKLPFAVRLDTFKLETYPYSNSPSGYKSEISIGNDTNSLNERSAIFMNNVLDRNGYRVFQGSYEKEADGTYTTILTANYDAPGTWITYFAYTLLSVGFILTLFNRTSRYVEISQKLNKMKKKGMGVLLLLFSLNIQAQEPSVEDYKPVKQEHCEELNDVLVMTFSQRIAPLNSVAFDVIRKLYGKDYYTIPNTEYKLSPEQFMIDIMIDPQFWMQQKIIKFSSATGLGKYLMIEEGRYLAYSDVYDLVLNENGGYFDPIVFKYNIDGVDSTYTIDDLILAANKMNPNRRGTFEKEVIKLSDKLEVMKAAMEGAFFKVIPVEVEGEIYWVSPADRSVVMQGKNDTEMSTQLLFKGYLEAAIDGKYSGNYDDANKIVEFFKRHQRTYLPADTLPSESMVNLEIRYNKMNLFNRLKNYYLLIWMFLLALALILNLSEKKNKTLEWILFTLMLLYAFMGILHGLNLGMRWYITGHAPWSDGYEALTTIAFGTVVAGIMFYRKSKITAGASALLAGLILMTAGHSKYDPQLTQLEPVLKSYWLNIHVACLTISYSFFGLGFILSLINLVIMSVRKSAGKLSTKTITELTYVNEMTLTIGLVLATIGTFLGGVWANESWGRYWGWDAKETWALVIVLVYAFVLHMRFVPGLRGKFAFNFASSLSFASVIMTFIGVNYYLTKGLHSYARGDKPVFAGWVWIIIFSIIAIWVISYLRERKLKTK